MELKPLKKYTSVHEVTVQDVLDVLDYWEQGVLNDEAVFCFAEDLEYLAGTWPDYPRSDSRSILFATLELLEMMYSNPTIPDDIPALRTFLTMGQSSPVAAWQYMDDYWDNIDRYKRLAEWRDKRYGKHDTTDST